MHLLSPNRVVLADSMKIGLAVLSVDLQKKKYVKSYKIRIFYLWALPPLAVRLQLTSADLDILPM